MTAVCFPMHFTPLKSLGNQTTGFVFVLGGPASRDHRRTKTFQSAEATQ
jgi:hypothetical protein